MIGPATPSNAVRGSADTRFRCDCRAAGTHRPVDRLLYTLRELADAETETPEEAAW